MTPRAWFPLAAALLLTSISSAEPLRLDSRTIDPAVETGTALTELLAETEPGAQGRHVLVQLGRVPRAVDRARLEALGVVLKHYIPVRGFLAWVERGAELDPEVQDWITWSAAVPTDDKLHHLIRDGITPEYAVASDGRVRFIVYGFPGVPENLVGDALQEAGAQILAVYPLYRRYEVLLPSGSVGNLAALDAVQWIEHTTPLPFDELDLVRVDQQADEAQAAPYNLSGLNVDLGQSESGNPDDTHGDLAGRVTDVQSLSTSTHATHVAGIALGDGTESVNNGGTANQWRGMAPSADVYSWSSSGHLTRYNAAINTHGIDAMTNSWGYGVGSGNCATYGDYASDAPQVDDIVTGLHGKRIPIFWSGGNERNDCDCGMSCTVPYVNYANVNTPKPAKNIITVGSKRSDDPTVANYSSWGPVDDGRIKPEIVAAGDGLAKGGVEAPTPGDSYGVLTGTSMAAPAAAGVGLLFIEDFRSLMAGTDPLPSTLKAHMIHTAEDMDDASTYLNPGPDYASGYGVLHAKDCIDQLRTGNLVEGQVDQGESDITNLVVPGDATVVEVTLVWDDEPGAQNADPALVNDLDLVVTDAGSTRRYPWTLDPAVPSADAVQTAEDHLNPVEKVTVDGGAVVAGTWTIEVRGTTVPMGPQLYSLVWSHDGSPGAVAAPLTEAAGPLRVVTLHPSHPNPFSPWTRLHYSLERTSVVDLRVLDVRGRVVRSFVRTESQPAGDYTYTWRGRADSGTDLPNGVYFVELRADGVGHAQKVTLLR